MGYRLLHVALGQLCCACSASREDTKHSTKKRRTGEGMDHGHHSARGNAAAGTNLLRQVKESRQQLLALGAPRRAVLDKYLHALFGSTARGTALRGRLTARPHACNAPFTLASEMIALCHLCDASQLARARRRFSPLGYCPLHRSTRSDSALVAPSGLSPQMQTYAPTSRNPVSDQQAQMHQNWGSWRRAVRPYRCFTCKTGKPQTSYGTRRRGTRTYAAEES